MSEQTNEDRPAAAARFQVFRFGDASPEDGLPEMIQRPMSAEVAARAQELGEAGVLAGAENRMLFSGGGVSLAYAWFRSEFPLPRHSHDSDCLYFIVGGTLRLGQDVLKAGDGFFVGADTPYTYTPGPDGVEILEFRGTQSFDIKMLVAGGSGFWDRALRTVREKREAWPSEARPSGIEG